MARHLRKLFIIFYVFEHPIAVAEHLIDIHVDATVLENERQKYCGHAKIIFSFWFDGDNQ
jgi:hypothetical protein